MGSVRQWELESGYSELQALTVHFLMKIQLLSPTMVLAHEIERAEAIAEQDGGQVPVFRASLAFNSWE